ncbi:uncharacterized protein LOC129568078 [Sitodiplosis mosellana]|uniref:uncharacterized protein LOC129568078 n=1 Tax=Sitodiplosis mosellana TaxID=263140 RepID=UPI002443D1A8|nr:uncharacterized protein LOC129568078 [Sitodiplosis mosellana]
MASSKTINLKRTHEMLKYNSKSSASQSTELSLLRYSFIRTLKMEKFNILNDPLMSSNLMVNTIGLQGISRKIDSYANCDAFLADIDTLVHSYTVAFNSQPAVKEVICAFSELCHRDVKSIRTCFQSAKATSGNEHMANNDFKSDPTQADVPAKRRAWRGKRDSVRGKYSSPFASKAMYNPQNAPNQLIATVPVEFRGSSDSQHLVASDENQPNGNKTDELPGNVPISKMKLNEDTNDTPLQSIDDELRQKRKAKENEPLGSEEKASLRQRNLQ